MKFSTVKAALGYYVAKRRGKGWRTQRHEDRIQSSYAGGDDWIAVGVALNACCGSVMQLDRLLRWATTADGVDDGLSPNDASTLQSVSRLLRENGLLSEPISPAPVEDSTWVDLVSGDTVRTKRLRG